MQQAGDAEQRGTPRAFLFLHRLVAAGVIVVVAPVTVSVAYRCCCRRWPPHHGHRPVL